nr:reverse transcriptase domain-containing protein [Tanacetum cinerariifolium]
MEEEESRAILLINETPAQKAAKRRRLNKEAKDVEELKQHLEIVPDEDKDVYTKATPLAKKCMRTRNFYFPNNSSVTIPRRQNKRRAPNVVEPELRTIVEITPMADNRTMEELLQVATEGYGEVIVIPEINADHFKIKTNLLQLVQANPYHGFERENPHTHINNFKRITSTLKFIDVPNNVINLMMFPYSLEGAVRVWYDKEPSNSILTWEDLIYAVTQIDTFYNGLNENDQDSLNVATGGNLLSKTTREALHIIDNKSKVRYSINKLNVSRMNTTSRENASKTDDRIDKLADQISTLVDIVSKKVITLATSIECLAATGTYNQVVPQNRASNYMAPPGFAPVQNSQNRFNQNQGQGNNFNRGNNFHVIPISEPDVPKTLPKPNIPYPSRLNDQKLRQKATNRMEKFFQIFQDLHYDISFAVALLLMPKFASAIKSLLENKDKLFKLAKIPLNENCSAMLLKKHPKKHEDPVVGFEADPRVSLILGRSFLRTDRALIDIYGEEITLRVNDEAVTFNLNQTTRYSSTYDGMSINRIDVIDVARVEYAQEILGISKDSSGGNPTSTSKPIISDSSHSFTPFEGSDFILEEIEAYLKDELISPEIDHVDCAPKGDICLIEKLLNDDPPWVSHIHCVPKKRGITVVENENNELIPTRLVTGWRVCIDYRNLNDGTRKDHFPLPFMDQMLERLAGNEFYCFLDGFSGYFQIPINPPDQEKTRPMTHLLEKETPFVFSKDCIDDFETLKMKLTEALILVVPGWNLPFELMCDASDFTIGAVLGQQMLAIVYAFEKFLPYLLLSKSIVYKDHSTLKCLLSKQDAKTRLFWWVLLLQEFDIIIRDKKGAENLVAHHLPRLENPHKDVFENKDINENFPLETFGKISSGSTPRFAD